MSSLALTMPWLALFTAAAMLWPPISRRWSLVPLATAYAWALWQGTLSPIVLVWIGLLVLASICVNAEAGRNNRMLGHALFIVLAAVLFLHWLPGFHNLLVIPPVHYTNDAVPFSMYLNLDKPLVAFWVVLTVRPRMAASSARITLQVAVAACAGAVLGCISLALLLDVVRWAPKLPSTWPLWLTNNALLVTLAEEALFRGYLQHKLALAWRHYAWGPWAAVLVAAVLFGAAHAAGGWAWILLASIAGVAYGLAYRWAGLSGAVIAHLGLNLLHYGFFTYPMRAA